MTYIIPSAAPLLEMKDIEKSFYGVKVLDRVSLDLYAGEVLALLGENGAGKSTLIKILNGDYQKDGGVILIDGQPVQINEPREAEALGIRMIYQEQHYAPELSVTENLLLGHLPVHDGLLPALYRRLGKGARLSSGTASAAESGYRSQAADDQPERCRAPDR